MPRCWHKNITLSTLVYMYYMVRVKTCKLLSRGPDNESIIPMIVSLSVPRGSTLLGVPYFPNTTILVFVLLLIRIVCDFFILTPEQNIVF